MIQKIVIVVIAITASAAGIETEQVKKDFVVQLYKQGAIKLEPMRLKNGTTSGIYFDMRMLISHPQQLQLLAQLLQPLIAQESFDRLCAVPYGALPLTTALALAGNYPMIMQRKEAKTYGTKKLIEGAFSKGESCVVVEDVITTGSSILETLAALEKEELVIKTVVVVIDREQGGMAHVQTKGYSIKALFTLSEILQILLEANCISSDEYACAEQFCTESAAAAHL